MCSKSIETAAVFTKTDMNYECNVNCLLVYEMCSKSIETEAVFTNMNNECKFVLLSHQKMMIDLCLSLLNSLKINIFTRNLL